jgi:SAM-dependent methyltransferase
MFGRSSTALAASRVERVLEGVKWPDEFPFTAEDFQRFDESPDTFFYGQPRFVTHIDDGAIAALTKYYEKVLPPSGNKDVAILDMCSSWISHYPKGYTAGRISGAGMNRDELAKNSMLTDFEVKDLNVDPKLPYEDNTFDVITNVVSVDYLSRPLEIFKEMHRVLKPGGLAIMSFSNRCFPTKAISVWTATDDATHAYIVGAYFHYSVPGGFTEPKAVDISPGAKGIFGGGGDPMYIVQASKKG